MAPRSFHESHDQLVARIQSGDERAFEELFRTHSQAVFRFAWSLTNDRDAAADILNDVFLWLWNHRTQWAPDTDPLTYLLGATRNRALNLLRNTRRRDAAMTTAVNKNESPGMSSMPAALDAQLERQETSAAIRDLLHQLPEHRRSLIILRWYHDLGWDQIASIVGISVGAAKMQHQRALEALRRQVGERFKK